MIRVSNRPNAKSLRNPEGPQIVYVDRVVEVPVESEVPVAQEAAPVEIIEVPVEKIVIQHEPVDLSEIHEKIDNHASHLNKQGEHIRAVEAKLERWYTPVANELEMQRRALVGLKTQRDIDRSRRLMLLRRLRKEQTAAKKRELQLKLAIGASIILSIVSLIVKL